MADDSRGGAAGPGTPPPRILLPLATGAEEMEVVIAGDVLRRAGVEVVIAGLVGEDPVVCSRKVRIVPDVALRQVLPGSGVSFDGIVLPGGGPGARALARSPAVGEWLAEMVAKDRWIGAICAAPIALVAHGIGAGRRMTSHPSVRDEVAAHATYVEDPVVVDGRLVTSRGPGTAMLFALRLVECLVGADKAAEIRAPMILPD